VANLTDFRRVARDVCNWGRWGDADELGTLNFITADTMSEAAQRVVAAAKPAAELVGVRS